MQAVVPCGLLYLADVTECVARGIAPLKITALQRENTTPCVWLHRVCSARCFLFLHLYDVHFVPVVGFTIQLGTAGRHVRQAVSRGVIRTGIQQHRPLPPALGDIEGGRFNIQAVLTAGILRGGQIRSSQDLRNGCPRGVGVFGAEQVRDQYDGGRQDSGDGG